MNETEMLGFVHAITRVVEITGIAAILAGAIYSGFQAVRAFILGGSGDDIYRQLRSNLGRSILLGLELLVAADIINTVAVAPTLSSVAVLAAIVLVRTFLSFSLEVEIEGRWPWQKVTAGQSEQTP